MLFWASSAAGWDAPERQRPRLVKYKNLAVVRHFRMAPPHSVKEATKPYFGDSIPTHTQGGAKTVLRWGQLILGWGHHPYSILLVRSDRKVSIRSASDPSQPVSINSSAKSQKIGWIWFATVYKKRYDTELAKKPFISIYITYVHSSRCITMKLYSL